jgi:DNA gyrase subunit A
MAASIPVHQLTQTRDFQQGVHFASIASLDQDEEIVAALTRIPGDEEGYLFLASVGGMVKRITLEDLPGLSAHSYQVMGLSGDALGFAIWTTGEDEIVLVSAEGMAIRFKEDGVRPMGLRAAGVKGIKLGGRADKVVGMVTVEPRSNLWVITNTGLAKSSSLSDYPTQGRYGQGVITIKFSDKRSVLAAATVGKMDDNMIVVTSKGKPKYMRFGLARRAGRNTMGESVIALGANEEVVRVVKPSAQSTSGSEE